MKRTFTNLGTEDKPKFWMLARDGAKGPKKRHKSMTDAINEAHRLLNEQSGTITILEAIGTMEG